MWDYCGMARNAEGLKKALDKIQELKSDFWKNVKVPGENDELNLELEKAERVADFIELGEVMIRDALDREESCGGHFREEYQTEEGEALRNDDSNLHVSAWEYKGSKNPAICHKEPLVFETVTPTQRSYK
jgi:succinate dehydrogenase / fumarate reductase flavoprotein subunit